VRVNVPTKDCAVCGRTITWRKKWERDWDQVKYCSDACRRRAKSSASAVDAQLEATLRDMLATRSGTVCPSEVARAVGGEDWRSQMEPARQAARRLVASGDVEITQGGHVVDPSTAKGPIRIRRVR
jgi:hypothetical protein